LRDGTDLDASADDAQVVKIAVWRSVNGCMKVFASPGCRSEESTKTEELLRYRMCLLGRRSIRHLN